MTTMITPGQGEPGQYALVDVDDTVVEVHGHAKQGAGFAFNRNRGLNALLATLDVARMLLTAVRRGTPA